MSTYLERRGGHLLTAAAALAAVVPMSALAEETPRYFYGQHMWDGGGGWWMLLGPLWMIIFLGILVALVVVLVRWLSGPSAGGPGPAQSTTPLDILSKRFARGEIDKAEFEERKRVLGD